MKRLLAMLSVVALLLTALWTAPFTALAAGKGDINNDGYITSADARLLLRACIGETALTQRQIWWGDYDCDGTVTSKDARRLVLHVLEGDGVADFVHVTQENIFGDRSVSVIGDSISYGSGSGEIPQSSYVGIIRQAVNAQTGCDNYGFSSVRSQTWESDASSRSYGINAWPEMVGTWAEERNQTYLMWDGFTSCTNWNYMDFKIRDGYEYKYFCVYYQAGPEQGKFSVGSVVDGAGYDQTAIDGSGPIFDCYAPTAGAARTAFFRTADFNNRTIRIAVQGSGKNVTITGFGYYNDISDTAVTVNNFSSGGLQLAGSGSLETGVSKDILKVAAKADTLIFSLGYNDSHFTNSRALFTEKIDYLIEQVNTNGTQLIVNDMCWYIPSFTAISMDYDNIQWYKSELKRLAEKTNGIYLDQQAINGDAVIGTITDGAHPNATGHRMIAETILKAMGV